MPTRGKYGTRFMDSIQEATAVNNGAIIFGNHFLSCPSEGGDEGNPRNLRSSYNVVAVVKYCGFIFGTFVNGGLLRNFKIGDTTYTGDHAEDQFMSAWDEFITTPIYKEITQLQLSQQLQPYITIKLSRSPCEKCTPKMINFIQQNKITIRLKLLQIYGGQSAPIINRECLLKLIQSGAVVSLWNIGDPKKGPRTTTKRNLPHELMYYTQLLDTAIQDDDDRELTDSETLYLEYRAEVIEKLHTLDRLLITFENMDKVSKGTRITLTDKEVLAIIKKMGMKIETNSQKQKIQIASFRETINDKVFFNDVFYKAARFLPFGEISTSTSSKIEEDYDMETGTPYDSQ